MKDFDWQSLVREHDEAPERDSEEWLEAMAAIDEDPAERERAVAADPLMMFRRLPSDEPASARDIESMKAAVKSLRRASELEAERAKRRPALAWPLAALLALGVSAALLTGPDASYSPAQVATHSQVEAPRAPQTPQLALGGPRFSRASLAALELPLVEDADPAADLVMQIEDEALSLVVVLTADQDV
ncbi:MAG: hypothetical protein AAF725_06385 [Acidobacteriota bacterium]